MKFTLIGALAATLLVGTAVVAPAATAASPTGVVVAQDQSTQLDAVPTAPRAVTVTTSPRVSVRLTARGTSPQTQVTNRRGVTTFTGLQAGTRYTVTAGDRSTTVIPVVKVGKASDLTVTTTDEPSTVNLTWKHNKNRARGGATIGYTITAAPANGAPTTSNQTDSSATPRVAPITMETTATDVELNGLDPQELYVFNVTPHNALGNGQASVARMMRSLADITGARVPLDDADSPAPTPSPESDSSDVIPAAPGPAPAPSSQPAPRPAAAPVPQPGPAPAPRPQTKTILVCPDGWSDVSGVCTQSQPYTFHSAQETQPYTYRSETRTESCAGSDCPGSNYVDFGTDWTGGSCPNGGTLHGGQCMGWTGSTRQVTVQLKNNPPAGWTDNGSQYVRTVEVKDPTPAGWSDNGSEWIRTTGKVEKVVPA